ncbi:MAG: hypothetical protein I4O49_19710 [Janthinobacterium lividum]|nr:hypothetical protein [Janthinobacterium lividum]
MVVPLNEVKSFYLAIAIKSNKTATLCSVTSTHTASTVPAFKLHSKSMTYSKNRFFQDVSTGSGAKIGAFCRLATTACGKIISIYQ